MAEIRSVLLVHPALPSNPRHKRILPLGLLYLGAYLRRERPNIRTTIIDAHILNLSLDDVADRILQAQPDLVGMGYWTAQAPFARDLSAKLKASQPGIIIVHGGVHPTSCPEEAAQWSDLVLMHEAENELVELTDRLNRGEDGSLTSGAAVWRNGGLQTQPPAPFISDLDSLPLPAWDMVPIERYDTPLHVVGGRRLPIIASRGCPYNCAFCVSPLIWKRKLRWRSGRSVAAEMAEAGQRLGINQFHFWDDNLLINPEVVNDMCNEIIDRRLDVRWVALTRAEHVVRHADMLRLLRNAGCIGIEIGIESADPKALQYYAKDQSLGTVEQAMRLQRQAGMTPLYTLMAFSPGETLSGYYFQTRFINRLTRNARAHRLFVGQFATAYPGTRFYQEASQQGQLLVQGWDSFHHHNIKFLPHSLLDDVPELTVNRLRIQDVFVLLLESYLWRYDVHPNGFDRGRARQEYAALSALVKLIDGRRSVRTIGGEIAKLAVWDEAESLRFAAFTLMIMAQAGLARSAGQRYDEEVRPRAVSFNRWYANVVYRGLAAAALTGMDQLVPACRS